MSRPLGDATDPAGTAGPAAGQTAGPAAGQTAGPAGEPGDHDAALIRGLPGWTLRVAVLALGVALALCAPGPRVPIGITVTLLVAAATTAVVPDTPAPTVLCVLAVATRVFSGGDSIGPRLFATALGIYAVHLLTGLALGVPVVARIDLRAFVPSGRRLGLVTLAFAVVFAAARAVGPGIGSGWLFVLAALAATGLLVAALAAGRHRT